MTNIIMLAVLVAAGACAVEVTPDDGVRVIDGDTIEVTIEGELESVRYYCIDAPEPGEPGGDPATAANITLTALGVVLKPGLDGRDRDVYGRLLRRVYQPDGDWIEALLVEQGHADWRDDECRTEANG